MYATDFSHFLRTRNKFLTTTSQSEAKFENNFRITTVPTLEKPKIQKQPKQPIAKAVKKKPSKFNILRKIAYKYCDQTTLHGIKYCAQKDLSWCEKLTWTALILCAISGISIISYFLQLRFNSAPLATVVESTIYPVANIPYPAVTICNHNRVNWDRVDEVITKYLKNASKTTQNQFRKYLRTLNTLEYGSFDEFIGIQEWNIDEMLHIDLLQVYKEVSYTCEELFDEAICWWRNRYFNCCESFSLQKSEYGLCYSFNSVLNIEGYEKLHNFTDYPWRTAQFADWSGLRVDMKLPNGSASSGVVVAITNPWEWPSNAYVVPGGTNTGIMVRPTYSYATDSVLGLTVNERKCLFPGETSVNGIPVMRLPLKTDKYLSGNCYAECRQRHMLKYCNCTISYFFETGNYTPCTMAGVKCLNQYDVILNYVKPPKGNPYFNDDEEGITCECWQECTRLEYGIEISPNLVGEISNEHLTLDVHFQRNTIVIYRTDLLYGWMDLLVGFGGIFGLFLGGSIISCVELIFYFIMCVLVLISK